MRRLSDGRIVRSCRDCIWAHQQPQTGNWWCAAEFVPGRLIADPCSTPAWCVLEEVQEEEMAEDSERHEHLLRDWLALFAPLCVQINGERVYECPVCHMSSRASARSILHAHKCLWSATQNALEKDTMNEKHTDMAETVREIVAIWLKEHGYDGLCAYDCSCFLDDLMPCGAYGGWADVSNCRPGYSCVNEDGDRVIGRFRG